MDIFVFNQQRDLKIKKSSIPPLVETVLQFEKCATDQVDIHFVSTKTISSLHKAYFDDPKTTDCISFPIDGKNKSKTHHVLGEVFICPKTAIDYCKKHGGNVYYETTLYLVHGLLHLLGYNDLNVKDKKKMRLKEKRLLNHLIEKSLILEKK